MKTIRSVFCLIPLLGCALLAQVPADSAPTQPTEVAGGIAPTAAVTVAYNPEQLDQLLGPIALYPDALIAIILPASANAADVVLAARFLEAGGLPAQADLQPWDDSVRALAHYPQLVRWMDQNLAWTKQLGEAFASQPDDVMATVQRLRARARAAGTLGSTAQQQVIYEGSTIVIVPTDPNVIYVPYYDPAIVYGYGGYYTSGPFFTFSTGFATGWWMCYGLDWPRHRVWVVNHNERERHWREHQRDWHRYTPPPHREHDGVVHVWRPPHEFRGPRSTPNRPGHFDAPAPGFDHRRDAPRPDHQREGSAAWRRANPTETASVSPRLVSPTANVTVTPAPAPNVDRLRDRSFQPRERTDNRPRPTFDPARNAPPRADTRPSMPDTRPNVVNTRPVIPNAQPAPTPYRSVRPFVPPVSNAGVMPPTARAPEPRSAPPMHWAPRPAPAPRYTPPPQPQPQSSTPDQQAPSDRRGEGERRQYR